MVLLILILPIKYQILIEIAMFLSTNWWLHL